MPVHSSALAVTTTLLPILFCVVPVAAVVFLAIRGQRSGGSCDAMNLDGSCRRCGRPAVETDGPSRIPEERPGDSDR